MEVDVSGESVILEPGDILNALVTAASAPTPTSQDGVLPLAQVEGVAIPRMVADHCSRHDRTSKMTPRNAFNFVVGTVSLAGISFVLRKFVPLTANTTLLHTAHFALAMVIALVLEWRTRRTLGHTSTLWIRGNPLLRWFLMNLAIWTALAALAIALGVPEIKGPVSNLLIYTAVFYLAAGAPVGVFGAITTRSSQ